MGLALLTYPERGSPLPKPRGRKKGLTKITVAPDVAAKLAVLGAFAAAGIAKNELGRRMGKDGGLPLPIEAILLGFFLVGIFPAGRCFASPNRGHGP